jgi:hypothetical protein
VDGWNRPLGRIIKEAGPANVRDRLHKIGHRVDVETVRNWGAGRSIPSVSNARALLQVFPDLTMDLIYNPPAEVGA